MTQHHRRGGEAPGPCAALRIARSGFRPIRRGPQSRNPQRRSCAGSMHASAIAGSLHGACTWGRGHGTPARAPGTEGPARTMRHRARTPPASPMARGPNQHDPLACAAFTRTPTCGRVLLAGLPALGPSRADQPSPGSVPPKWRMRRDCSHAHPRSARPGPITAARPRWCCTTLPFSARLIAEPPRARTAYRGLVHGARAARGASARAMVKGLMQHCLAGVIVLRDHAGTWP